VSYSPSMDPAELERLRENSGLRLDRDGNFFHEGQPVEHPKVIAAFRRGLARSPDGRPIVRFGRTWAYIEVEGTLWRVVRVAFERDAAGHVAVCIASLDDGSEERVTPRPGWLGMGSGEVLCLRVRGGTEWARCLPEAHADLGAELVPAGEGWGLSSSAALLPVIAVD
jgi:hypothetical protein